MRQIVEEAVLKFEQAAINHGQATDIGDYKTGNKSYDVIIQTVRFLREQNELFKLGELLNHESDSVRIWAATYLLPLFEDESLLILSEIAKGNGIRSFGAQMTIQEWNKGNLKLE